MPNGTAALAFRIVVRGIPFLLKINTRTRTIGSARQFACMKAAAEVGLVEISSSMLMYSTCGVVIDPRGRPRRRDRQCPCTV